MGFFSDLLSPIFGGGGGGGGSMSSGGIGNSSSTNENFDQTHYTDSHMVLGEGAGYTTISDANNGNSSWMTAENSGNTYIQTVDADAVGLSFAGIDAAVGRAFNFGTNALQFGQDALGFGEKSLRDSLSFAAQAQQQATNEVNASLAFARDAQAQGFAQSSASLGQAVQAMGQALQFGSKQSGLAMDSMTQAANLVNTAYADAKGRGAMTDYLLMGAIAAVVFVAWRATK